jgi:serine O-acetyltransferase
MMALSAQCLAYGHHKLSGVRRCLSEDVVRYLTKSPENLAGGDDFKHRLSAFLTPELLCLSLYRASHYLWAKRWRRLAILVSRFNFLMHKVSITPQSCIGPGCRMSHPAGVTFHGRAGRGLTLFSLAVCCSREDCWGGSIDAGPRLGDRVTIGAHAVLLGPIIVGDDAKIAFSVRLDRDSPAGVLVVCASLRQTRCHVAAGEVAPS